MKFPPYPSKEQAAWDLEETKLFLGAAKRQSEHYPLYLMACSTGMRQGELLGLRWRDIDWAVDSINVRQAFYRIGKQEYIRPPKTKASRRTIDVDPGVLAVLRELQAKQAERKRIAGTLYHDHDLVFAQANGKPLHSHNLVRRDFRDTSKAAGVRRIKFHGLRHTHASQLARMGVSLKVVSERLGHSSPAITLALYSHSLPGMQREAAQKHSAALLG